jgi:hypothetical protein
MRPAVQCTVTADPNDSTGFWAYASFSDIDGKSWTFHEKTPVLFVAGLPLPAAGHILCTILERTPGPDGRDVLTISTEFPCDIPSLEGETYVFRIAGDQLEHVE